MDALARFPVERARALGIPDWDLRDDYRTELTRISRIVLPWLTTDQRRNLVSMWESYVDDDENFVYEPTFLHADLSVDHLLVTGERVSGLIDFGDAEIGDPDYELAFLWMEGGERFVRQIQAHRGRELTPRQREKLTFWVIADAAGDVAAGWEDADRSRFDEGLATLRDAFRAG